MRNTWISLLLILFIGCAAEEQEYFSKLNRGGEGLFRGVQIKDGANKVKQLEDEQALEVDEEVFLKYNYLFDEKNEEKGHYEIEYYFDGEDQLHEIIINAFVTDKTEAHELYEALIDKFTKAYGNYAKNKDGYVIWQGKTTNTNQLEIALIDDSKYNEATGYLTLQINDFDY